MECLQAAVEWNDDYKRLNNLSGDPGWVPWARKLLMDARPVIHQSNNDSSERDAPQTSVPMREWLKAYHVTLDERQLWAVESYLVMNVLPLDSRDAVKREALEKAAQHCPETYHDVITGCECGEFTPTTSSTDPALAFDEWQQHIRALAASPAGRAEQEPK